MHFTRPEIDSPLLAELYSHQVISQSLWNGLPKPEEGTLTEVVRDGADEINPATWAYWLVKRHNFVRVPNLRPDQDFHDRLSWPVARELDAAFYGCYPMSIQRTTAHVVSLRPDVKKLLPELLRWLNVARIFFFALIPSELPRWENLQRKSS